MMKGLYWVRGGGAQRHALVVASFALVACEPAVTGPKPPASMPEPEPEPPTIEGTWVVEECVWTVYDYETGAALARRPSHAHPHDHDL